MHRLNGRYAQHFNAVHGWSGHLWGDRFALWQVRDDAHLAAACDYVLANPVRAGSAWSDARRAAQLARSLRVSRRA